ncbi:MAG: aspartate aminotransferase family protein [Caldisericota bacterium]|nr:aspartate aminotransferase family protein [Caldisericota bacterium]
MGKFISLTTAVPGPKSQAIAKRQSGVVASPMNDALSPAYIAEGHGALVTDVDGNTFIDLTGGWGCMAVGHSHPRVIAAIKDQVDHYVHTDFTSVPYEPYVTLAEKLVRLAPGDFEKTVALFNSGAEAIENAVKIARHVTGRSGVVVFDRAFHGRTLLTMTMTHKAKPYKAGFGPFAPDVYRMPFVTPYHPSIRVDEWERLLGTYVDPSTIACFVVEPIQGEGGFRVPSDGFLQMLREVSHKYGILLVVDEIQAGVGRTGKFFSIENWNIAPDIICSAKSLAAGMPLSAVIARKDLTDRLPGSSIGGTYVGNPVACRAAIEVLNIVEEEHLMDRALAIGGLIRSRWDAWKETYPIIGDVRGMGAMQALEFVKDRTTREPATVLNGQIIKDCLQHGVLVAGSGIYGNCIRMLVSLEVTDDQLNEALDVLESAVAKADAELRV